MGHIRPPASFHTLCWEHVYLLLPKIMDSCPLQSIFIYLFIYSDQIKSSFLGCFSPTGCFPAVTWIPSKSINTTTSLNILAFGLVLQPDCWILDLNSGLVVYLLGSSGHKSMPDRLMYFTVRCLGRHFCPLFLNFLVDQVWQCAYLVPLNSLLLFLSHVIEDGLYFGFFLMCLLGAWLASRVHFSDRALFYTSNTFCLSCSLLMAVKCLWFFKKKKKKPVIRSPSPREGDSVSVPNE